MAEAIALDIATEVLIKLGSSTFREICFLCGAWDERKKLQNKLSVIKEKLVDAEEQQAERSTVKDWIKRLKDVLYDADDLLDDFATEELRRKVDNRTKLTNRVRDFFSSSNQFAFRFRMGYKIKEIRERIDEIANDMNQFNFMSTSQFVVGRPAQIKGRGETHSWVSEDQVIGREKEKEEIIGFLFHSSDEKDVSVISVVGIGGLGKTTLAKYIYNDERVQKYFDQKLWVCVSEPFDVKQIVERILESATGSRPENLSLEGLQKKLQKEIEGKKYLLVLDDVWNEDRKRWDDLETLLIGRAKGSKILVTTRSKEVAKIIRSSSHFELSGLSDDKSWSLFKTQAFEQGEEPTNPEIVSTAREIVKKCCGVPLAIKTLGSLLLFRDPKTEWSSFNATTLSKVAQDKDGIMPILKLSYDHLPSHLKQCFAYCSLFPKDYKLRKQTLIRLWMAQGFIQLSDREQQPEDVGEEYFMKLLWGSFFQDEEKDWWGNITCKMHDLMHDLAKFVAGNESYLADFDAEDIGERIRHVSFNYKILASWDTPTPLLHLKKIRTFLVHHHKYGGDIKVMKSYFDRIVPTFSYLRALDLHGAGIEKISSSIGKLKHLRYIDLSYNMEIEELPNSICKLQNLQTLSLKGCTKLKELPRDFTKLVSLRHLDIEDCNSLKFLPRGLGQLTSLRTLILFSQTNPTSKSSAGLNELNALNNLRGTLKFSFKNDVRYSNKLAEAANMKGKEHLRSLSYSWSGEGGSDMTSAEDVESFFEALEPHSNLKGLYIDGYRGVRFPCWTLANRLHNLVEVEIRDCPNCQQIPPMHQLPYLKRLILRKIPKVEYIIDEASSSATSVELFFPSLEFLSLDDLSGLKEFWRRISTSRESRESTLFHKLVEVEIRDCPNCQQIPPMHQLPYLKSLTLRNIPKVEYIIDEASSSATSVELFFPSLEYLVLRNLSGLKEFWRRISTSRESRESTLLHNLVEVKIRDCPNCQQIPPMHQLPYLKRLSLRNMNKVEYIIDEASSSATSVELFFPSLEYLQLLALPGLKEFWRRISTSRESRESTLLLLTELRIINCPGLGIGLRSMPLLPNLQWLKVYNVEREVFNHMLIGAQVARVPPQLSSSSLSSSSSHLSKLKHIDMSNIHNLEFFPPGVLQNLTSLDRLYIYGCDELRCLAESEEELRGLSSLRVLNINSCGTISSLSRGIQHLTALKQLRIWNCPSFNLTDDGDNGMHWQGLRSLRTLHLRYIPKLVSLPAGIQHVTTLQCLRFDSCEQLMAVPEWISNLTSLQLLYSKNCPKLKSLPKEIGCHNSLEGLVIDGCPDLTERCQKHTGDDWHLIARIPNIKIDDVNIQGAPYREYWGHDP